MADSQKATIEKFTPDIDSRRGEGLTREVVDFIRGTEYADLPDELISMGKKSILDGFGLALSGSVAESGRIVQDGTPEDIYRRPASRFACGMSSQSQGLLG